MKHGDAHRRFNMPKSQRRALFANLTNALLTHEQITITLPRAKELRTFAESMITYAKKGDLNSRRLALSFLRDKEVVSKLFSVLAERYKERNGGYTRVLKSGFRYGDCAPMAIIEMLMPKVLKILNALRLKKLPQKLLLRQKTLLLKLKAYKQLKKVGVCRPFLCLEFFRKLSFCAFPEYHYKRSAQG